MDILEKLKEQGWYLTEEAIKKLPEDVDKSDPKKVIQAVMDMDLRGIAEGALSDITKKDDSIPGRRVLQVVKIRNISAPKANEESKTAPRLLQLELTDGVNQIFALEFENISSISLNTPPGTKLYLRSDRIPLMQGQLVLRVNDIQLLGGKVQQLIEKWEMARTLQKYTKSGNRMVISGSSGPPPWIPFGQKIQQPNIAGGNDKNFKSLGGNSAGAGDKETKEKNEFDTMRSEAIAEAAKAGAKKVFGGGNQQLLDHNIKKIMEKGFTEEEARNALKANRNILEQALYNLKRRDELKNKDSTSGRRGGFKDTKKSKSEEPVIPTKPAANVSLFDFLTDKLPTNPDSSDKNVSNKPDRPKSLNHDISKSSSYHSHQQQQQYSYNHQHQNPSTHYQSSVNSHQLQKGHHQQQQQQQQQQQSQYQQQQQQQQQPNHANYNHTNRPKFENNLSSSFANRNTMNPSGEHDNYKSRDKNHRDREENAHNVNAYSNRQKDSSDKFRNNQRNSGYGQNQKPSDRYSGYQKSNAPQSQSQQHQMPHQQQSQQHAQQQDYQQQQSQYQLKTSTGGNYDSRNRNEYQKRNGFDNTGKTSTSSSRYHPKEASSYQPNVKSYNDSRQSLNANDSGKMNKLVEETSKMKIDSSSSSSRMQQQGSRDQSSVPATHQMKPYQHQQQQPPPPPQQAQHLQQRPPPHSQHQQMQQQQQQQQHQQPQPQHSIPPHTTYTQLPNGFTYDPSKIMGFQSKEANEYAMTLLKSQAAIPPMQVAAHAPYPQPIQIPPSAFSAPQFVMPPTPTGPPPGAAAYSMGQCGGGEAWNWKIGDRCLAKYWDDGRYYEAEVTGVSDKTCVVLYLGYGNHEEVLKSDCLPITDAQHRPINVSKLHETHSLPTGHLSTQQAVATAVAGPLPGGMAQHAMSRGMHSGRYRGERQMYVPPPKRDG